MGWLVFVAGVVLVGSLYWADSGTYERLERQCSERGMKHVHPSPRVYFCKDSEGRLYDQTP